MTVNTEEKKRSKRNKTIKEIDRYRDWHEFTSMELDVVKGICIVVFFLIPITVGSVPLCLASKLSLRLSGTTRGKRALSYINCFAGGVFLGTCLMSVMSEGMEQFEEFREVANFRVSFPFFEVGIGAGFFLVALVEKLAHRLFSHRRQGLARRKENVLQENVQNARTDHLHDLTELKAAHRLGPKSVKGFDQERVLPDSTPVLCSLARCDEIGGGGLKSKVAESAALKTVKVHCKDSESQEPPHDRSGAANGLTGTVPHSAHQRSGYRQNCGPPDQFQPDKTSPTRAELNEQRSETEVGLRNTKADHDGYSGKSHSAETAQRDSSALDLHEHGFSHEATGLRILLLFLALSFHTVFDGLAVGLQTRINGLWSIMGAITIHKAIVSACLGLELAEVAAMESTTITATVAPPVATATTTLALTFSPRLQEDLSPSPTTTATTIVTTESNPTPPFPLTCRSFLPLLLFALMAPVGVAVGMVVTSGHVDEHARLLAGGVLQAVATGAFLYVTCFEILGRDMASGHEGSVTQVLTAVAGYALMCLAKIWDDGGD